MRLTLKRLAEYVEWSHGDDSGLSSRSLLSYATGINFVGHHHHLWYPSDSGDLGRCIRLLRKFPELRRGLKLAAKEQTSWAMLVDAWDELEELYDHVSQSRQLGGSYIIYNKMRTLRGEEPIPYIPPKKKRRR